jgi:hypothetical protein
MLCNDIGVHGFSEENLLESIRAAANAEHDSAQAEYLARYCTSLGVRTIVCESHYMDRHYVDEFALYYCRMLLPPRNAVARLHFFALEFTQEQFDSWLEGSFESAEVREDVQNSMSSAPNRAGDGYLGFCSIRPIASVPIGRTIVATLPKQSGIAREIWATTRSTVHLANLVFHVDGLAFQQQDAAVGACATAALWSALAKTARQDGIRAPTPAEISDAATHACRSSVHPLLSVSKGLTTQQLCDATKVFGFTPERISGRTHPEFLVTAVHTYLLSGMPVVLLLLGNGEGHAVTAAGFQLSSSEHPKLLGSVPVRSARMTKLYVHDDQLGPYARAFIEPFALNDPSTEVLLEGLTITVEWNGVTEQWVIDSAIAPVYPKLRLHVQSLVTLADYIGAAVERLVGPETAAMLRVDFRYERSGDYLSKLAGRVFDPRDAASLVRRVVLSRWCAIVRWYISDSELVEFVFDTTDVVRNAAAQVGALLRAIVSVSPEFRRETAILAESFDVPAC